MLLARAQRSGARAHKYNSADMSILKVARMGHPVLRARTRAVERAEVKSPAIQKCFWGRRRRNIAELNMLLQKRPGICLKRRPGPGNMFACIRNALRRQPCKRDCGDQLSDSHPRIGRILIHCIFQPNRSALPEIIPQTVAAELQQRP